ncbi:hypothetical protein BGAL_0020g00130 [Botrytis galanthina]|uniref:DUF302 domain-containing protein n=1 Tax=Botrytis galanthina TaxID=278940 RepID=A0A4S8RJ58_9HELO|nr:hypothetical protein BGAL_0020g00130 [Botrytis galanthina]
MAHESSITSFTYSVTRKTSHTSLAFETVMANLYASIGKPTDLQWPTIAASITSHEEINKEKFVEGVEAAVGPQGFMNFGELNHGCWLPLFNINSNPQLGLKRIILGNPLIAITMLSQSSKSLDAGLFVPVEILVRQLSGEQGTEITWQVPSTLIGALDRGNNGLLTAAQVLDGKLEELITFIGSGAFWDRVQKVKSRYTYTNPSYANKSSMKCWYPTRYYNVGEYMRPKPSIGWTERVEFV